MSPDLEKWLAHEAQHYDCEDCWYSCAKLTCDDRRQSNICDCGADALNARKAELRKLLVQPEANAQGAKWVQLDDHVSTPSTTHILSSKRGHPFVHWFTTMYKEEFYVYKVTVPPFDGSEPHND